MVPYCPTFGTDGKTHTGTSVYTLINGAKPTSGSYSGASDPASKSGSNFAGSPTGTKGTSIGIEGSNPIQ